jgi:hypothetical protein
MSRQLDTAERERVLIDNWTLRLVLWPVCALRRHRPRFWLDVRWNGVVTDRIWRCSCGTHGGGELT